MTITQPSDIDLAQIVRLLPPSAYRLRAFTRKMTVVVSREFSTLSVRMRRDGPEMQVNPDFAEKWIETEYDLAMVVFHEWLHVLREHLDARRVGLTFGLDVENEEDLRKLPKATMDRVQFVQELEIKHLEHLLMPDDHFHELNRRYYADSPQADVRLLYRGSDPALFDDVYYEAIHGRIFSRGRYSTREAYYLLQERAEELGEDDGEGQPGKGDPGDGPPMIGSGSGIDKDVAQEVVDAVMEAVDQLLEKAREAASEPAEKVPAKPDEPNEPDENKEEAKGPPGKQAGTGTLIEEEVKYRVQVARNRRLEQAVKRIRTKPNYIARVTAAFSRVTAKARSRSTVPNYLTDRRAQRDYVTGRYRARFTRRKGASENLFALYFDISYSQDDFIPHCNEVVLQLKHMFVDQTVFVFSDYVVPVPIGEFVRRAKAGTVTGLVRSRGTNFTAVAEHAKKNGLHQLAVLTDNECGLSEITMAPLTRRPDFYLLLIDTNDPGQHRYKEAYKEGGFVPFMNERIYITPTS